MSNLWIDVRYAARVLRRSPAFALTAVIVIALGIGANSAIFSLVDAVLIRPLPYSEPDRLVRIWERPPGFPQNAVSLLNFQDWRDQNRVFSSMGAVAGASRTLTAPGMNADRIPGQAVTVGLFDVLGMAPIAGRSFTSADDAEGANAVIISDQLWTSRFGRDAGLIGRQITLDSIPRTVVGVMPASFHFLYPADLWTPLRLTRNPNDRRSHYLQVIARLKPGVSLDQARSNMESVAAGISAAWPETNKDWSVTMLTLRAATVGESLRTTSLMLALVAAFVMLMGCSNVAALLLARGVGRSREIAVRAALGVSRARLLQQLLTESTLLASWGGMLGFGIAWAILRAAPAILPAGTLPVAIHVGLDSRMALFASIATLIVGILFGLAPAWQALKLSLSDTLRSGGRTAASGTGFRTMLATVQIALAVVLVAGAGLLLKTLVALNSVDAGFQAENVLTMRINPVVNRANQEPIPQFLNRVEQAVLAIPHVRSAGTGINLPVDGWDIGQPFDFPSDPIEKSKRPSAHYQVVSAGWFDTLGIPILAGRPFNGGDSAHSTPVCIVNEEVVRQYLHGENPIGKRIRVSPLALGVETMEREIVGVVKQIKVLGLAEKKANFEIYVPSKQDTYRTPMLAIRVQGEPMNVLPAVRRAVGEIDPNTPLTRVRTMDEVVSESITQPRFRAVLVSIFAGLAIVLAAVGIFGLLSFSVDQRTREFGIRMALGAQPGDVVGLVLRRALAITIAGSIMGLIGAVSLTRLVESLLFGVKPLDPVFLLASSGVLIAVALAACAVPAIRASRTAPTVALRTE